MQMFHRKGAAPIYKCYNGKGSSNMKMLSWKKGSSNSKCYHGKGKLQYANIMEKGQLKYINVIMEKRSSNM